MTFKAFSDSSSSYTLDNLTFENQGDRLSIYGSLQITEDQQGLAFAQQLADILQQTIKYLEQQDLPEQITSPEDPEEMTNPFWQEPKK